MTHPSVSHTWPARLLLILCLGGLFNGSPLYAQEIAPAGVAVVPDPPILLTPADGARTTAVTDPPLGVPALTWEPVISATAYQVQVSTASGFAATVVNAETGNSRYTPVVALGDGVYYWRVRAKAGITWGDYSPVATFIVDWSDGGALFPALLAPDDGATRAAFAHADFSWEPVPGAATYQLQIATNADMANVVYSAVTITPHHTSVKRLGNSVYYWQVKPFDNKGHAGAASPVRSFTFHWSQAPQLLGPAHGADLPFSPRFSWTAVEAAKEYRLQISTQDNFVTFDQIVTRNSDYTPFSAFSNDQDYFWRVQAVDGQSTASPWSEIRRFRTRWNFQPALLSPANNSIHLAYPFFSWAPVAGAERYQIRIANNSGFDPKVVDTTLFNVTHYTQPDWPPLSVHLDSAYYWQVRAIDAQGNYSPWSDTWSFQFSTMTTPNLVYPLPYYTPDTPNVPVHGDRSFNAPLFIWDSAHAVILAPFIPVSPDFYRLQVDDDPAFSSPNFAMDTAGLAAAPTLAQPFTGLQDGQLYYWRVSAVFGALQPLESPVTWTARYRSSSSLPQTVGAEPIYPADAFEAVQMPPVLGWLPVTGAAHYRVQVARDSGFTSVVDDAQPQSVNYVPWQGRLTAMPYGMYWWRVRAEDGANNPIGGWSAGRHFNLSVELAIGNLYDFPAPVNLAEDTSGRAEVAGSPEQGQGVFELKDLYTIVDRRQEKGYNQHWAIAFTTGAAAGDTLTYALYFDTDHKAGSGGGSDPRGNNSLVASSFYRPEYVLYVDKLGNAGVTAQLYGWTGSAWAPGQSLSGAVGGSIAYSPTLQSVQIFIPYTAIASAADWAGSLAFAVYSLNGAVVHDSVPLQGATLDNPVFVSNMLLPLYPFDTPFSNPIVHEDMPPLRWRMPAFGTDGYQVQVARDSQFTDIVETWESYETKEGSFFTLIPSTFQSKKVYANNESYYWRVRTRHEKFRPIPYLDYDYGPWSPAMRFKLDSRLVGNPQLTTGVDAFMTPTFTWERVEGAAGYTIQIDDDSNFSNPLIDQPTDANSYTPVEVGTPLLPGTQYYWRVVMRRADGIIGHWSAAMTFLKTSLWPEPVAPPAGAALDRQPTLQWQAVFTPTNQPRLAAPQYRIQVANNPAFTTPKIDVTTQSTSFTPAKGQSLADGLWYWRVAFVDANNKVGAYSPAQSFTKEYPLPPLLSPAQNDVVSAAPTFVWAPTNGAAYYKLQYADNPNYNSSTTVTTDLTQHMPTKLLGTKTYFWRVQMYDFDRNPGSLIEGRFGLGFSLYLPTVAGP